MGEVRTAIRVFNESHRVHREPNVGGVRRDRSSLATAANGGRRERKYSHAYGHCHSYDWGGYFLDSGCSYVHLQARGNLHLFGLATNNGRWIGMASRHTSFDTGRTRVSFPFLSPQLLFLLLLLLLLCLFSSPDQSFTQSAGGKGNLLGKPAGLRMVTRLLTPLLRASQGLSLVIAFTSL